MIDATSTFRWRGQELHYLDDPYNTTILNERALEVPIARAWLQGRTEGGLEVGNVLSHYGPVAHRIVDLYEQGPGVENIDVRTLTGTYPWVVAISTLEHVGQEDGKPAEAVIALGHLLRCLEPGGALLATVPMGQNPSLDEWITFGGLGANIEEAYRYGPDGWVSVPSGTTGPLRERSWPSVLWIGEWHG